MLWHVRVYVTVSTRPRRVRFLKHYLYIYIYYIHVYMGGRISNPLRNRMFRNEILIYLKSYRILLRNFEVFFRCFSSKIIRIFFLFFDSRTKNVRIGTSCCRDVERLGTVAQSQRSKNDQNCPVQRRPEIQYVDGTLYAHRAPVTSSSALVLFFPVGRDRNPFTPCTWRLPRVVNLTTKKNLVPLHKWFAATLTPITIETYYLYDCVCAYSV